MKQAILYINQFFGGVGAEDHADFEPMIREGTVGPGLALQNMLNDVEITHTLICGDNYMTGHTEEALARFRSFLEGKKFDLFLAGPAFQSGRYGMSCGEVCKFIRAEYKVPCVTCMNEENPGVDSFKTADFYIMRGSKSAAHLKKDAKVMAEFANKLMAGEEILWADAEGYFSHGVRKDVPCDSTPVDRAVDMLLKKLRGESFVTEFPIEKSDRVPPAPAVDPKKSKIALITSGGIVPAGNPDRIPSGTASIWKSYDITAIDSFKKGEFYSVHGGYSTDNVNEDPEVLLPLSAVKELLNEGEIGQLYPEYFVTTGNLTVIKEAKRMGAEIAQKLLAEKVDAVIFVTT